MEVCRAHPGFALAARAFRVVAVHVAQRGGRQGGCLCHGERLAPANPRLRAQVFDERPCSASAQGHWLHLVQFVGT